jgi:hypothetical protein
MKSFFSKLFAVLFLLPLIAAAASAGPLVSGAGDPQGRPLLPPNRMPGAQMPGAAAAAPAEMKMRVEDGFVTGEIRSTPIQKVLEELAARTGLVFEVSIQEDDPVTITFYKVTIQEAVQRLTGTNNSIFYYGDAAGGNKIQMVRIFSRPGKTPQPSLRYIGTGAVTRNDDDIVETPEQAVKALAENKKVDLRQKAVEILVAAKGEAAIQALTQAVGDAAPEVKVAAIEGLATLGARSALPQILKCLGDPHPGVRQSAIVAVALLGDAVNLKELLPLRKDPDASVATAAETAIKKLSTRRPGP